MFSELRSQGPRLPPSKLHLPAAIEWVGARMIHGWNGSERQTVARADEGVAAANHIEPSPEPPAGANDGTCLICGNPATRIRAGKPYCAHHGKRQPIPPAIRKIFDEGRHAVAANASEGAEAIEDEEELPTPEPAALFRWAEAHAALRNKVLAGELRAALRAPGGKVVYLTADEWCTEGFPDPDKVRTANGAHVVFEATEMDRAFGAAGTAAVAAPCSQEAKPTRRSHHPTRDRVRDRMAKDIAGGVETLESLRDMTEQYRADRYGVKSRETARLALEELCRPT